MKKTKTKSRVLKAGGVTEYIAAKPKTSQKFLKEMRAAVRAAAPGAIETMSYFDMPGYASKGDYDYNGMFAWFSYKAPFVRLHVRPEALIKHKNDLREYQCTRAVISFPHDEAIPKTLVKKLVKASLKAMKDKAK